MIRIRRSSGMGAEEGILQLYRTKEDGADRRQLTYSERDCRMPACSPDGEELVYVQQVDPGLSLRVSDIDGKNVGAHVDEGVNLLAIRKHNS